MIYLLTHFDWIVGTRLVAEVYGVSQSHMNKVIQHRVKLGLINATRGREGEALRAGTRMALGRLSAAVRTGW